jgi:2-keto-4-pentenoate hydratase/2-oxohepta-3-ene-1,7-dioic acid hydratase in catechol pathway
LRRKSGERNRVILNHANVEDNSINGDAMKLISFSAKGRERVGVVVGDGIVDLTSRLPSHPAGLRALLAAGEIKAAGSSSGAAPDYSLADVKILPVVPNPDKVLCVGLNYKSHVAEVDRALPDYPMIFARFADSQVGPGQPMIRPRVSQQFDYEGELAVIIGKAGRHIPREQAMTHVSGYSCFDDGSVRDFQNHTTQFTPGKNFAKSGAFGPWLVTPDEAGLPQQMTLETRLNGQVVQHASVSDLVFDVPRLIEYCSSWTELLPGDVIVTGTPSGVGAARKPPVWLNAGDVVEVEITRIGTLKNSIEDEGEV